MFGYWLLILLLSTFVPGILLFIFMLIQFRPKTARPDSMHAVLDCRTRCVQRFFSIFFGINLECTRTHSLQRKMKERTSQKNHTFSSLQITQRWCSGSSSDQHPPPPSASPVHLHVMVHSEVQQKPKLVPQPPPYPPPGRLIQRHLEKSNRYLEVMEFSNIICLIKFHWAQ